MTAQDGDIIEVAVIHDNTESGEQINNYQYQVVSGGPVADADLLDDIAFFVEVSYNIIKALIDVRNVLREVVVRNKTRLTLVGSTDANTYNGGSSVGNALPQGCAAMVYFKTGIPRVVLSKFVPSFGDNAKKLDGRLTTGAQGLMLAYATDLAGPHISSGRVYAYGYLSPKSLAFEEPTVVVVPNVFAYQRRRKPGRGS